MSFSCAFIGSGWAKSGAIELWDQIRFTPLACLGTALSERRDHLTRKRSSTPRHINNYWDGLFCLADATYLIRAAFPKADTSTTVASSEVCCCTLTRTQHKQEAGRQTRWRPEEKETRNFQRYIVRGKKIKLCVECRRVWAIAKWILRKSSSHTPLACGKDSLTSH